MGQYKVPQNVEAEDKIIGPLTLKQFIYTIIGLGFGLVTWFLGRLFLPFYIVGAIPTILFLMLGLYQRQDQPFDALFLAIMSYFVKPRERIWLKEPIAEVFKIEVPKPAVEDPNVDPRQVYGELEKLSQIVDTRGWSAKQPEVQEPDYNVASSFGLDYGDRIATDSIILPENGPSDIVAQDDILDVENNQKAKDIDRLIQDNTYNIRDQAMAKMRETVVAPTEPSASVMTPAPLDGIMGEMVQNSELKVSQIAAQAHKYGSLTEGQAVSLQDGIQNNSQQ
jgi:hypothetical protein